MAQSAKTTQFYPTRTGEVRFFIFIFCFLYSFGLNQSPKLTYTRYSLHTHLIGAGLVGRYQIGQSIKHGFWFGCVDFSGFLFCSSLLVLMCTVKLWLYSDFYGFDDGCGGVMVVNEILFYCNVYITLLC